MDGLRAKLLLLVIALCIAHIDSFRTSVCVSPVCNYRVVSRSPVVALSPSSLAPRRPMSLSEPHRRKKSALRDSPAPLSAVTTVESEGEAESEREREQEKNTTSSLSLPSSSSSSLPSSSSLLTAVSIALLVLQNSGLSLTMRLSRIGGAAKASMYVPSTAVLLSELLKFAISYLAYLRETQSGKQRESESESARRRLSLAEIASDVPMLGEVAIPSALYVLQNNLQYVAMSALPAAVYQVLVQTKIITAAVLSRLFLQRSISVRQWVSIVSLTLGVIVVQLSMPARAATSNLNLPLGLLAVGLSCLTSGYAGVKLEATLKDPRESLWVRNLQISVVSIAIAALACAKDWQAIAARGFFSGYSPLVLLVIAIQAVGGILVSLVVKHTSTIVKGFATAASIILTALVSALLLQDVQINARFIIGSVIVCLSTIAYSVKK